MPNLKADIKNRLDGRHSLTVTSDGVATVNDTNISSYQLEALIRDCRASGHDVSIVSGALTIKKV